MNKNKLRGLKLYLVFLGALVIAFLTALTYNYSVWHGKNTDKWDPQQENRYHK